MKIELEAARVAIVDRGGVRIAVPEGMSKLELALVLQSLSTQLLEDELAPADLPANGVNGNGHRAAPVVPDTDRFAGLEVSEPPKDRRGMPRKKVVSRRKVKGGTREKLECGHVLKLGSDQKEHKSRACEQCAQELAAS